MATASNKTRIIALALSMAGGVLAVVYACGGGMSDTSPCAGRTCPEGYSCDPATGNCVDVDGGILDMGTADGPPPCASGVICGPNKVCCDDGQVCDNQRCVPADACQGTCQNDTYCDKGVCIPWGTGPGGDHNDACIITQPIGIFSPAQQCAWTKPPADDPYPKHVNVLGTPMVVDFDFDGDAKIRKPSIVFASYNGEDGSSPATNCDGAFHGVIRVIDGDTCTQQHTVAQAKVRAASPLAIGDLDLDGRPDIVAMRCGGGLVAFSYDAAAKQFKLLWTSQPNNIGATAGGWAGPAIHDLDDDGKPEILLWGTVWNNTGALIDGTLGQLTYSSGYIAVAADLDNDGKVELTNGGSIWEWVDNKWTAQSTNTGAGHVAVADFGTFVGKDSNGDDRSKRDGLVEIAIVSQGKVRIANLAGRTVFGPVNIPSGGSGGPPTIGDFDNDGRAEFAAAGSDSYSVFDPDCLGTPQKATCHTETTTGVLWSQVSQDHTSSETGSSIFDFDGDGAAEAVYADECFTRVYDGKSGEVLYSQYRSSCTWYENPIVADVDGDFNSELVVPSNTNCNTDCTNNPKIPKHPTSGLPLDPLFAGLRCEQSTDCPGGDCSSGFCRCSNDGDCGGGGFVCSPPVTGTAGGGDVCRAAYLGATQGILVYRDALDRWVSSRMIWNQHAYAVTHVEESGKIPKTSDWKSNWTQQGLNNYRQNVQGTLATGVSPDLTAGNQATPQCDVERNMTLKVRLCNRGMEPVGTGIPVSFYEGPAADGKLICTAMNKAQIDPGNCEEVSCVWPEAPTKDAVDVHVVADDDGSGAGQTSECDEGNNTTVLKSVLCNQIN